MLTKTYSLILLSTLACFIRPDAGDAERVFTHIYEVNDWGASETRSGIGSTLDATEKLRIMLQALLIKYNIKTINDAPCGDFNWMRMLDLHNYTYRGFDIVKDIIAQNNKLYGRANISFSIANIISDILPQADLIICRDVLHHLPNKDCIEVLRNFKKSKSKYLLTTTYPRAHNVNNNIRMGSWQLINLCIPPYNLPKPLVLINEGCKEVSAQFGSHADKSMGLWLLDDINI